MRLSHGNQSNYATHPRQVDRQAGSSSRRSSHITYIPIQEWSSLSGPITTIKTLPNDGAPMYTQCSFRGGMDRPPGRLGGGDHRRGEEGRGGGERLSCDGFTTGHISATHLAKNDASLPEKLPPLLFSHTFASSSFLQSISPGLRGFAPWIGMGSGTTKARGSLFSVRRPLANSPSPQNRDTPATP